MSKSLKQETTQARIIKFLKNNPSRAFSVSEIAQEVLEDKDQRNIAHYHLKRLKIDGIIAQGKDQKYQWAMNPKLEKYTPLLEKLAKDGPILGEDFDAFITKQFPGERVRKVEMLEFFSPDYVAVDERSGKIKLGINGAKLLHRCFVCGQPLENGELLAVQDQYCPEEVEEGSPLFNTAFIHITCVPRLYANIPTTTDTCMECHLPLGAGELMNVICPDITKSAVEPVLVNWFTKDELDLFNGLKHCLTTLPPLIEDEEEVTEERRQILKEDWEWVDGWNACFKGQKLSRIETLLQHLNGPNGTPLYADVMILENRAQFLYSKLSEVLRQINDDREKKVTALLHYYYGARGEFLRGFDRNRLESHWNQPEISPICLDAFIVRDQGQLYHCGCHERVSAKQAKEK